MPEFTEELVISYADAAAWLPSVPVEDRDDQIRDWAVWGLGALLNLDTETLRSAFYDQVPLRDPLLTDFTRAKTGPGRALLDGANRLHVLIPAQDPYAARSIGTVLDDYRKDAGEDPGRVIIYRYEVDPAAFQVTLKPEPALPAEEVRARYGYREMRVDALADLQNFLAETHHLARLELRAGQLWAGGWNWPGIPTGQLTAADLTVIQNGYENAAAGRSTETGFSLDAGDPMTVTDLIALLDASKYAALKTRAAQVADFVTAWVAGATLEELQTLAAELGEEAFNLLLDDDKLLELLLSTAEGRSPYQVARYDGGLQGTEAGMTYFYTDLVAKAWAMGIGNGNPAGIVPGFVSNVKARTPWGHCTTEAREEGRLWFGLRDEAISPRSQWIDLGSITTRVFTLIDDPQGTDREVEPSYSFGRIIWWWDLHYAAMADYEPQYHRLDQLMRWSSAIAWLMAQDSARLPEVPAAEIRRDWQFSRWLQEHPELKWKFDVPFVNPPGETTEALLKLYSDTYADCGSDASYWAGGISNPGIEQVYNLYQAQPLLPPALARGAQDRAGTTYSPATRTGVISDLAGTRYTLGPAVAGRTQVAVVANGRKVWSGNQLKVWASEFAPRQLARNLAAGLGTIREQLSVQEIPLGDFSATATATEATIRFTPGRLALALRVIAALQSKLEAATANEAPEPVPGASLSYVDPAGDLFFRLDSREGTHWMTLKQEAIAPPEEMAFRLGAPGSTEGEIRWYTARFSEAPTLDAVWMKIQEGKGDDAGVVVSVEAPTQQATKLTADYFDSALRGTLYYENGQHFQRTDDPVFGLTGTGDGRLLGKREAGDQVRALQQAAQAADDGYARLLELPNRTIVLVGAQDAVRVVPADDLRYERLQAALSGATDKTQVLEKTQGDQVLLVTKSEAKLAGRPQGTYDLAEILKANDIVPGTSFARGPPLFFSRDLASQLPREVMEEGRLPAGGIGGNFRVRIVQIAEPAARLTGLGRTDVVSWDGTEWLVPGRPPTPQAMTSWASLQFHLPGGTPEPEIPAETSGPLLTFIYGIPDCDEDADLDRCE